MSVKWTESYELKASSHRHFKIFVSENDEGNFYSSCLWYEGDRALKAPGESGGGIKFDLKTIFAKTSQGAFDEIKAWAIEKFGSDVSIEKSS